MLHQKICIYDMPLQNAFMLVMNKNLCAALIKICTSRGPLLLPLLKCTTHHPTVLTDTVWSPSMFNKGWWMSVVPFFLHRGIQWHTFTSHTLPCQTLLCQTAPLLPSVTQQQNGMGYRWEGSTSTAIPPTYASDVVSHHHKIGGITFRAALITVYWLQPLFNSFLFFFFWWYAMWSWKPF